MLLFHGIKVMFYHFIGNENVLILELLDETLMKLQSSEEPIRKVFSQHITWPIPTYNFYSKIDVVMIRYWLTNIGGCLIRVRQNDPNETDMSETRGLQLILI